MKDFSVRYFSKLTSCVTFRAQILVHELEVGGRELFQGADSWL